MSAGSAFGMLFNILIVGAFTSIMGWAIDKSNFAFAGLSADASNFIGFMLTAFGAVIVIVYLVFAIINYWINSKDERSQEV